MDVLLLLFGGGEVLGLRLEVGGGARVGHVRLVEDGGLVLMLLLLLLLMGKR